MKRLQRVDLEDVARAAGVSRSTASRALRGEARVSAETTQRVLETAEALGYVRDIRAAELASTAATTVGLLIRGAERSFYGEVAAKVQAETDLREIDLLVVSGGDDHASQVRALNNLLGHGVAGIMVASGRASLSAAEHAASFVSTVLLGLDSDHASIDSVAIDPASEALLARHVAEAGHRRVAVTTSDQAGSTTLQVRTSRFREELERHGATTSLVHGMGDRGPVFAAELRRAIDDGATAVMAGDDPTAVEILELLGEWGLRCPDDVSVTGFDGVGVFLSPLFGLTTMRQPVEQMARWAVQTMVSRVGGAQEGTRHVTYPGQYRPGRTLGPPPRGVA
ncbi:MAG: LacI family DNA-binding transcriptional regulator [Dietzia sp.]|nr:LacI family DNA-binding transcriptional regulator [Dietzia sp.]